MVLKFTFGKKYDQFSRLNRKKEDLKTENNDGRVNRSFILFKM